MTQCYAYIRVSTTKQEGGVSLQEQRSAIEQYAKQHQLAIVEWFQESVTAAKRGRRAFARMISLLGKRKADGVIIHKIDRGARNLGDWAALGELIDAGVAVHFAHEHIDLKTRGGRLAADIQAVVAADFIRNNKEESRKGFYGRLKQGLYPLKAPLGYKNRGCGKAKTVDRFRGPLVRRAFDLYATGHYSLQTLSYEMSRLGLRTTTGTRVSVNRLSRILNNPFYTGLIRVRTTGETFAGIHEPLIPRSLFDQVQAVLKGRLQTRAKKHTFPYRRLVTCQSCGTTLIGERQKGHVYYRCHTKNCPTTGVRGEAIDDGVAEQLARLTFTEEEQRDLDAAIEKLTQTQDTLCRDHATHLTLSLGKVTTKLDRLTDAFLDGDLDKQTYNDRKERLLRERLALEEKQQALTKNPKETVANLRHYLELAHNASLSHKEANDHEKRELVQMTTSNRTVEGKSVAIDLSFPFFLIANRGGVLSGAPSRGVPRSRGNVPLRHCAPSRDVPRTRGDVPNRKSSRMEDLVRVLWEWLRSDDSPGLSSEPSKQTWVDLR